MLSTIDTYSEPMKTVCLSLLCASLLLCAPVFAENASLEAGEKWPVTVDAAVADLLSKLSAEDKEGIRQTKRGELIKYHFGWGMGIRNTYGLWRGNVQLLTSACGKPCHPDDASMIIIEKVWEALQTHGEQPDRIQVR